MRRKKDESILEILCYLPWWVSVSLSIGSYVALKYIAPLFQSEAMASQAFLHAAPNIAPMAALFFIVPAPVSAILSWRKHRLLDQQKGIDSVRSLDWRRFETLVGEAYRRKGYAVSENRDNGPDGGVDLRLRKNGEQVLVQCKHWKAYKVDVKTAREFYGVIISENASGGILITSGTLTRPARDFLEGKPIKIVEGKDLMGLIAEVRKGRDINDISFPERREERRPTCPRCGSGMVLRTAKTGPKSGQRFWGCSTFPRCRGLRTLEN